MQEERQAADGFARPGRFCKTFHYHTIHLLKYSTVWICQVLHYYSPLPHTIYTLKYSTQCAWACQVFHYYFPLQHTICTIKYSIVQDCHVLHSQPVFLFYHCCSCHHLIILSSCHLVILSSCHHLIILSSYHLIILSSCLVILSSSYHLCLV